MKTITEDTVIKQTDLSLTKSNSLVLYEVKFWVFIFCAFILSSLAQAQLSDEQKHKVDSLKQILTHAQHDTVVINAWMAWDDIIYVSNPYLDSVLIQKIDSLSSLNLKKDLSFIERNKFLETKSFALNCMGISYMQKADFDRAIEYYEKSLKINEELENDQGKASALTNIGNVYLRLGDYATAIVYFEKSLEVRKELNDLSGLTTTINNLGLVYKEKGDYNRAIDYFSQSLKLCEKIENKELIANTLNNLGTLHSSMKEYSKAYEYYSKCLKIDEQMGNKIGIAISLHNIGNTYYYRGILEEALEIHLKSLQIHEELSNMRGVAATLMAIGNIYSDMGYYQKAQEYNIRSLEISNRIGMKMLKASSLNNLGILSKKQGNHVEALNYSIESFKIAREIGSKDLTKKSTKTLWEVYKNLGKYQDALSMYELHISAKDSLSSEENQKAIIRQEYKYQYEKQAAADSIKNIEAQKVKDAEILAQKTQRNAEKRERELEKKRDAQQSYFLVGILTLSVLFGLFIFNRFRLTKKQRDIIDVQKREVEAQKEKVDEAFEQLEEKNTEILDSINYAKRIQSAILPPDKLVKEYLPDSFVLYKPKDIVAGDFYWCEPQKDRVLFAAADCTGHGVPGAMVSVVCNNGLNRSVREYGLTEPGDILSKTREIVISEFEKSEEEVKDGMDVALCSLEGNTLKYAGAHNPLWVIRAGAKEVEEIKAHKQPIGKYTEPSPYPTHTIELNEGDSFYIFSDGYADQFGGERGKKFKTANFKRLLLSIQKESIEKQREIIDKEFENWKGSIEQLDDVCVIGVRV